MRTSEQLPWGSLYAILALLIGATIMVLGANFMLNPHAGAAGYGVTVVSTDADAFLRAKGLRDIATGIVVICLVAFSSTRAVALALLSMTTIPVGDAIIVATSPNPPSYAVPMHATTALVILVLALLMLRRARQAEPRRDFRKRP